MTRFWCAVILAIVCVPVTASAQGTMFGSFGVAVSHGYDSNVLAQPEPLPQTSDSVSRLGPILEAGYRSSRFRTVGQYEAAVAERYWQYSALNRRMAHQQSHAEIAFAPGRHVTVSAVGEYINTYTPIEIGVLDAFMLGRVHAERLTAHPTFNFTWRNATIVSAEYDFAHEMVEPFAPAVIHTPHVVFSHEVNPQTALRVSYRARRFSSSDVPTETSHAVQLGITRRLGRLPRVEFDAGPRRSEGRLYPEVNATLRHPLRRGGEVMVGYAESEGSVLGEQGIIEMRSVLAALQLQIARPLRIDITPTVYRAQRGTFSSRIAAIEVSSTTQLASRVALVFSGQAGRQAGDLGGVYTRIPYFRVTTALRATLMGNRDREPTRAPVEPIATPPRTGTPRGNRGAP
jgi:hypothetical protein